MIVNNNIDEIIKSIKNYFETYVKTYLPYKDNPVYKAILDTLIENYYNELYVDTPSELLNLTVKNLIDVNTIDGFLVEIGLPEDVIRKLNATEKWVFLQVFADFTKYKSTIQFFQLLGEVTADNFPEKFDVYELWVDYDDEIGWILRPKLIYKTRNISEFGITYLLYDDVYNNVPTLLISQEQLDQWRQQNRLILPFKSNLILIVQSELTDVNVAKVIARLSFLKTFGDFNINLYFSDKKFVTTLRFVDQLWYYLLWRYYNHHQFANEFNHVILFSNDNSSIPDISQVEHILQKYSSITTWSEYDTFYRSYIEPFMVNNYSQSEYTHDDFYVVLNTIDPQIMEYLDDRLSTVENEKQEILIIIDEIYGSLLLSLMNYVNNIYYQTYLPLYMESLSKIFINVSSNNSNVRPEVFTTKILLNLKPFHTDVVFKSYYAVKTMDHEYISDTISNLLLEANFASVMSIGSDSFFYLDCRKVDSLRIISFYIPLFLLRYYDLFEILDRYSRSQFVNDVISDVNVSDDIYSIFSIPQYEDSLGISVISDILYKIPVESELNVETPMILQYLYRQQSFHVLSDRLSSRSFTMTKISDTCVIDDSQYTISIQ